MEGGLEDGHDEVGARQEEEARHSNRKNGTEEEEVGKKKVFHHNHAGLGVRTVTRSAFAHKENVHRTEAVRKTDEEGECSLQGLMQTTHFVVPL